MSKPGVLTLKAQLDLTDMLRPAVQPGSRIDYTLPPETVSVVARSPGGFTLTSPGATTWLSRAFSVVPQPARTPATRAAYAADL